MSTLTRLYDGTTQVGNDIPSPNITLTKVGNALLYNGSPVDQVVSRVNLADPAQSSLVITVANGSSWRLVGAQRNEEMTITGPKTDGGIRWTYQMNGELRIEVWYPNEGGASDIDDDEGIEWSLTDKKIPPVTLKIRVKRLTI